VKFLQEAAKSVAPREKGPPTTGSHWHLTTFNTFAMLVRASHALRGYNACLKNSLKRTFYKML